MKCEICNQETEITLHRVEGIHIDYETLEQVEGELKSEKKEMVRKCCICGKILCSNCALYKIKFSKQFNFDHAYCPECEDKSIEF